MTGTAARAPASNYLVTAVWLGLCTGLAEAAGLLIKKFALGILILANPQIVWMGPLVYVLFFVPIGLALAVLSRRWPRTFSLHHTAALLALLGAYFALRVFKVQLHPAAIWILAAGIAVRVGRAAAIQPDRFARAARRGSAGLAMLVLVLATALNGGRVWAERRALGALPAAAPDAPNVLLIILDTVRGLDLGLYGSDLPTTPEIERHARTGVVFTRAVATASWTNPSHASLFTGRFPHDLTADWSLGLDGTYPTLAEVLRDHGYRTAGFVANTRYVSRPGGLARGFIRYEDHRMTLGAAVSTTSLGDEVFHQRTWVGRALGIRDVLGRVPAPVINGRLLRWLDTPDNRPFFAALNYMDAHAPLRPPEPYASRFGVRPSFTLRQKVAARFRPRTALAPDVEERARLAQERAAYDASIAYLDREIGSLLDELEWRRLLDNTLVILTSDHGEEFGEHGTAGHGYSLYWPVLHVPLIVWFRGRVPGGARVEAPVSLRDIAATVLDLARIPGAPRLPGATLARHWNGTAIAGSDTLLSELSAGADAPRRAKIGLGDMKSLVIGTWHYIRNGDGSEELYDVATDPWETRDVIGTADSATLAPFRAVMATVPVRRRAIRRSF